MALKFKRTGVGKTVLLWAFIVICLVLLFAVVQKRAQSPGNSETQTETYAAEAPPPAPVGRSLLVNVGPVVLVLLIWGSIVYRTIYGTRRRYRQDTNLHGVITATVDRHSFASRSTTGASVQCLWSAFQRWLEMGGIVLLGYPNGTFAILNVAGLSDMERQELRRILAEVLPEKK